MRRAAGARLGPGSILIRERKLVTELGREPTPEEIAEATGIDAGEGELSKRTAQVPVSLEKPGRWRGGVRVRPVHRRRTSRVSYERAAEILTMEALENLRYRERSVAELRYRRSVSALSLARVPAHLKGCRHRLLLRPGFECTHRVEYRYSSVGVRPSPAFEDESSASAAANRAEGGA